MCYVILRPECLELHVSAVMPHSQATLHTARWLEVRQRPLQENQTRSSNSGVLRRVLYFNGCPILTRLLTAFIPKTSTTPSHREPSNCTLWGSL